ncbi:MAG: M14 family metallopeptidase [Gemmatimonadota bacterium]|nr:M14 family metallopeptidase [Gemmatimonadota bacterium]
MRIAGTPRLRLALGAIALGLLGAVANTQAQSPAYLDFNGLTRELRSLTNGSDLARLRSLGKSREGRDIWLVEIGATAGAPLDSRPALLVVGNLSGDHVVGSMLALETVRYLLAGTDSSAATVLNTQVVYIVPRLNPDAAEGMFAAVKQDRRRNALAFDDDNDGRVDEDPAEDLDGDGLITVMRKRDPAGEYMVHPDDARLMKLADATQGEAGGYTLYVEGRDSDGDGYLNEDGLGGVDLDRNFQHAYPYWERDAGPYMVSEPESRALMDFMIAHGNIGAVLTYGHSDNLVTPPDARGNLADASVLDLPAFALASNADLFEKGVFASGQRGGFGGFGGFGGRGGGGPQLRGAQPGRDNDPSAGRRPATTVNAADLKYFEAVSKAYKEITGITKVGVNRTAEGAFFQYGYYQFGVPAFGTQGWGLPQKTPARDSAGADQPSGANAEARPGGRGRPPAGGTPAGRAVQGQGARAGATQPGADAAILGAMDSAGIEAFVPWTSFTHPDLGEVEIGGFRPYAVTNPPAADLGELGRMHGTFAVRLAGMLPQVRIANTEVKDEGGGVFTVSADVENVGYFPTALQHGVVSRSVQPTTIQIQVPPEAMLTGDDKTSTVMRLDGSGGREHLTWVIRGQPGASVEIRVLSQKGGTATTTVTLR